MKWYYTRSEEENNLKSSGNEKWGLIKNSLQIYNSLFDTSGNGECLSIFHYWFLLFIIFCRWLSLWLGLSIRPLQNHQHFLCAIIICSFPEEKKPSVYVSYLYLAENTWEHFDQKNFYFSLFNKVWLFCSKLIGMHSVSFLWEKGSAERHKKRQLEPDGILSDRLSIPFYSFCINYLYWTNIFSIDNFRLWSRRKKQLKSFDYYLYMDMQKRFRIDAGNRKS